MADKFAYQLFYSLKYFDSLRTNPNFIFYSIQIDQYNSMNPNNHYIKFGQNTCSFIGFIRGIQITYSGIILTKKQLDYIKIDSRVSLY